MTTLPIILNARTHHKATLIFLHGIGPRFKYQGFKYENEKWPGILDKICPDYMKIICPIAPSKPVKMYNSIIMPAWYNVNDTKENNCITYKEDLNDVENSTKILQNIVKMESKTLLNYGGHSRIIIGGFSQGGAIAINALLQSKQKFAGCVNLSGYLIENIVSEIPEIETPIFHTHGENDIQGVGPLNIEKVRKTFKVFKENAMCYEFHNIPNMGHEINEDVLELLNVFIKKHLQNT